jgi:hypothetical protein
MLAVTPSMHERTDPASFLAAYIFAKTLYKNLKSAKIMYFLRFLIARI